MKDLISIVVPVYRVEAYLDQCVKSLVSQTYPHIEIILVDDGSPDNSGKMCDELRKMAEELGISDRLHLLGYRKDVPELCYAADIFCFPSCREGLGLAAIEGMACGLPLITFDKHGINDYSVDGVTGYKCEPTDAEGFAKAIEQLANDPPLRESMGKGNITRAQKYDVDRINQLMRVIYAL